MNRIQMLLAGRIALIQKQAAVSDHSENCDQTLAANAKQLNEGGTPASAGNNASNAATFETPDHAKKPSSTGPTNNVPDNEDTTPRQKEASLSLNDLLMKSAATQDGATADKKLEEESGKEVVGGGNGNEVQSAQESDKAPALKVSSSQGGGDSNSDQVPRSASMDKAASFNAGRIFSMLKGAIPTRV